MNPHTAHGHYNIQPTHSQQTNGFQSSLHQREQQQVPSSQQQSTVPLILPAKNSTENSDRNSVDMPRPKRSRVKRSCDLCRKRKTKCNANVANPCHTCQNAGVQCQFLVEQKKRGPNARNYIGTLENRLKRLEGLLQKAQGSDKQQQNTKSVQKYPLSSPSVLETIALSNSDKTTGKKDQSRQQADTTSHDTNSSASNEEDDDGDDGVHSDINGAFHEPTVNNSQRGTAPSIHHICEGVAAQQAVEPTNTEVCNEMESVDPSLELVEYFNQLQLTDYERTRYIGGSAGYHMIDQHLFKRNSRHRIRSHPNWVIQKVNDDDTEHVIIKAEEMREKPQVITGKHTLLRFSVLQDIPSLTPELVDCMIHAYFNHIHPHCPIVNKISFIEQYYFQNPHAPDEYLLYAICAVSTLFLSMEDDLVTGTTISRETVVAVRSILREKANKILEVVYKRSQISTVQTLILLSMFVSMAGDDDDDSVHWFITGTAIRMAQDLGLHRSSTRWLLPENEIELRRRIWYAVYIMDKWIAAELGRPVAILDEEFDVELPSVYEITSLYHSESREAEVRHMKPALLLDAEAALNEKRPVYAAFLHMISLGRTLGQVLVSLYSPKMQYAARRNIYLVDTLNMALTKWKMSIPPDLQCEDNKPDKAFPNGGMMHIFYNCVLLLLHHPFITDHDAPNINNALQALSTCTAAAINIIDTVEALESMGVICMPWCIIGYATFQAAIVFLFNARSDNEYIRRQGAKNLMRCAWAYHKDECMSKSRTSKVLCQLTRRFSVPIVAEEENREKELPKNKHMPSNRSTRKRDYEGDISSRWSSPDKQSRTALRLGNTSEEAIYFISLPREIGADSLNRSSISPGGNEQYGNNSNPVMPRNITTKKMPTVVDPSCIEGTTEDSLMEMFYPTCPTAAKNSSSVSAPQQQQQQPVTEPTVNATITASDHINSNDSRPNSELLIPCDIQGLSSLPTGQDQQNIHQQPYDIPVSIITPNNTIHHQEQNQFNFVDSLLTVEEQQPRLQSQPQEDLNAQFTTSILNHPDDGNFDLASLSSDVPMWNLPSGVTWSEWDSLLNDSSQGTPQ